MYDIVVLHSYRTNHVWLFISRTQSSKICIESWRSTIWLKLRSIEVMSANVRSVTARSVHSCSRYFPVIPTQSSCYYYSLFDCAVPVVLNDPLRFCSLQRGPRPRLLRLQSPSRPSSRRCEERIWTCDQCCCSCLLCLNNHGCFKTSRARGRCFGSLLIKRPTTCLPRSRLSATLTLPRQFIKLWNVPVRWSSVLWTKVWGRTKRTQRTDNIAYTTAPKENTSAA